jgi:hypothetical protein
MAAPRKVDYARIEASWRAGIKSAPQLAAEYTAETGVSVSHVAITKHFKKLGVPRDLAAKVKAKADAMVIAAMVANKVDATKEASIIVEAAGQQAGVRLSHRSDISRSRSLALKLLTELESLGKGDLSLERRVSATKTLSDAMKTMITLEREAWGLSTDSTPDPKDPPAFGISFVDGGPGNPVDHSGVEVSGDVETSGQDDKPATH